MLAEDEYQEISDAIRRGVALVQSRMVKEDRRMNKGDEPYLYREVADRYLSITGFDDVDHREILRHRLILLGPPCANCGKELRTPLARKCVECGWVKE